MNGASESERLIISNIFTSKYAAAVLKRYENILAHLFTIEIIAELDDKHFKSNICWTLLDNGIINVSHRWPVFLNSSFKWFVAF